jgi:phosphoglycolate phosphatase-like HAD superfamily hydrolase
MKLFVWDFHGVMEQGNDEAVLEISNHALQMSGYAERFQIEDIRRLYGLKWWEYFADLIPSASKEDHLELQQRCLSGSPDYPNITRRCLRPTDGLMEVLGAIEQSGNEQILISNCLQSSLVQFVDKVGIGHFFEGKYFSSHHPEQEGYSKAQILAEQLAGRDYDCIVIVGDSPTDIDLGKVARRNGFSAVTYLYAHPGWEFKDCLADHRIRDLREVLREL